MTDWTIKYIKRKHRRTITILNPFSTQARKVVQGQWSLSWLKNQSLHGKPSNGWL